MENKIVCPVCQRKNGLFKVFTLDGRTILHCQTCRWTSQDYEHHEDIKDIPSLHDLEKEQR